MKLIENALPKKLFLEIKELISNKNFDWKLLSGVSYEANNENVNCRDYCLSAILLHDGVVLSSHYPKFNFVFHTAMKNLDEKIKKLTKVRINCFLNVGDRVIHQPHIDYEQPHKVAILFLNDSDDSETFIYNESYDESCGSHPTEFLKNKFKNNVTISTTIKPKENSMFLFDGFHYHATSTPTSIMRRISIVFNYETF
jgi:hypothetical protein